MHANDILAWIALALVVWLAVLLVRGGQARRAWSWLVVAGLIGVIDGLGFGLFPAVNGYVASGLYLLLVVVPLAIRGRVEKLGQAMRFRAAARLWWISALLHPFDLARGEPALYHALALLHEGKAAEARELLAKLDERGGLKSRAATLQFLRLEGRWVDLVEWLERDVGVEGLLLDADRVLTPLYLRGLGEVGRVEDLIRAQQRIRPGAGPLAVDPVSRQVALFTAAFSGLPELVEALLDGPLSDLGPPLKAFWLATGEQTAGRIGRARERLQGLARAHDQTDDTLQIAVGRRLTNPPAAVDRASLSPEVARQLDEFVSATRAALDETGPAAPTRRSPLDASGPI
jgi:hypothetical protein